MKNQAKKLKIPVNKPNIPNILLTVGRFSILPFKKKQKIKEKQKERIQLAIPTAIVFFIVRGW